MVQADASRSTEPYESGLPGAGRPDPSAGLRTRRLGTITGSTRAMVDGGDGSDTLVGGAGPDTLQGGADADFLDGSEGADSMEGGSGSDTASYAGRSDAVTASLDGTQNDGTAGEGDAIAGDVENVVGGDGADTLSGNAAANFLSGGAGEDFLDGGAGQDVLDAGRATDLILLRNGKPDGVTSCGSAPDFVIADPGEMADPDCELVDNEPSSRPGRPAGSPCPRRKRSAEDAQFAALLRLRDHVNIPFFSTVHAIKAPVRLDAARQRGRQQLLTGVFDGGIFGIRQGRATAPSSWLSRLVCDDCTATTATTKRGLRLHGKRRWINAMTTEYGFRIREKYSSTDNTAPAGRSRTTATGRHASYRGLVDAGERPRSQIIDLRWGRTDVLRASALSTARSGAGGPSDSEPDLRHRASQAAGICGFEPLTGATDLPAGSIISPTTGWVAVTTPTGVEEFEGDLQPGHVQARPKPTRSDSSSTRGWSFNDAASPRDVTGRLFRPGASGARGRAPCGT